MASDFWIVLQWWGTLFLVGAVAYPLTKRLFGLDPRLRGDDKIKDGVASRSLGEGWWDGGYLFSKAVGMAVVTWIVFVMGTLRVMPFSVWSIGMAMGVVFVIGIIFQLKTQSVKLKTIAQNSQREDGSRVKPGMTLFKPGMTLFKAGMTILIEELFFLAALLFWSWVKGHEPSIRGLEKFMDYGFMQSILNAHYFPPADMWYAPLSINYYYFGHMVTAVLTKLSGLDLGVTFNLMLATIFSLTLTMSFSIGYQLITMSSSRPLSRDPSSDLNWMPDQVRHDRIRVLTKICAGLLTSFLVTLAGNMQTIYAFTRGYTGENVKPFWELGWNFRDIWGVGGIRELLGKIGEGMNTYWYPNATRFIPLTIHEFPSYSFVVSDVHGHVLSIPFVLLAIALLIQVFLFQGQASAAGATRGQALWSVFYGFLIGILLMTNALDGPIYFALLGAVLVISNGKWQISNWKAIGVTVGLVLVIATVTSFPFLLHFKSFVTGVAVNCPPSFLANMKLGPILFEGVEKCQRSPLWMWWLLWGFFVYCGVGLVGKIFNFQFFPRSGISLRETIFNQTKKFSLNTKIPQVEKILLVFFVFALVLVIVPEFIYFKDIYPAHFRSNTMFKLGYEAYILFSIVSGYAIVTMFVGRTSIHGEKSQILNPQPKADQPMADKFKINPKFKFQISKILFILLLLPQLFLVSIYPIFSVRSYFNSLKRYEGIDGLGWLRREYPADYSAIEWLNSQNIQCPISNVQCGRYAIVEADGDSYTDYARVSTFTGRPTIIGWAVHEWLWRGTYDVVAPRREEVRQIYESEDLGVTRGILDKYNVRHVVVGKLEREKFKSLQEWKFFEVGREVFRAGGTVIYEVGGNSLRELKG